MGLVAFLLSLVLSINTTPARAEWVSATGSYIYPPTMSEAEACQQAESRARADSIKSVTGETISSEDIMRCAEHGNEAECARNSTTWIMIGGEIRSIRDKKITNKIEQEGFKKCVVTFRADVHAAHGQPDPNFTIGVSLNNDVFRSGENLSVILNPSKNMFVQVFQWLPYESGEGQISKIFPNQFDSAMSITNKTTIPTLEGSRRYDLKVAFPENAPSAAKMIDEYLMVVATKNAFSLRDAYSLDDFNKQISEIPVGDRRLVRRAYSIVRGGE